MLLIIDDDKSLRTSLAKALKQKGHDVREADSAAAGLKFVEEQRVDLILLDNQLGDGFGVEILPKLLGADDAVDVIMITAYPDVKVAVDAMRIGARDFIVKPFDLAELFLSVDRVLETRRLRRDVQRYQREDNQRMGQEMLGQSGPMVELREQITKVAATDAPVLVTGETGSGKELVARAIHRMSRRADGPLVTVNCSAFSDSLLESELFGHEKGAFTGANESREGVFEMSHDGTLFLDEIGELRSDLQAKVLRVVEGHPFRRVGGKRELVTNVRIVAATNRDLPAEVKAGRFREDLWFRLNALPIAVPPLRARGDDSQLLAREFIRRLGPTIGKPQLQLQDDALAAIARYHWPGNVRELRNLVERAAILSDDEDLTAASLPAEVRGASAPLGALVVAAGDDGEILPLGEMEHRYVVAVLERLQGNISETARVLGVSRNTVKARLQPPL